VSQAVRLRSYDPGSIALVYVWIAGVMLLYQELAAPQEGQKSWLSGGRASMPDDCR
jgi:hypothetical protein